MDTLSEHSSRLLVLDEAWQVVDVELSVDQQQVRILLRDNPKQAVCCPDCGEHRPRKDHAPVRSWRRANAD